MRAGPWCVPTVCALGTSLPRVSRAPSGMPAAREAMAAWRLRGGLLQVWESKTRHPDSAPCLPTPLPRACSRHCRLTAINHHHTGLLGGGNLPLAPLMPSEEVSADMRAGMHLHDLRPILPCSRCACAPQSMQLRAGARRRQPVFHRIARAMPMLFALFAIRFPHIPPRQAKPKLWPS